MLNFKARWAFAFLVVLATVFVLGAFKLSGFSEGNLLANKGFPEQLFPAEEIEKRSVVFVGDIMLARSVERSLLSLPRDHAFLGVKELFKDNVVVGNFEASVPAVHEPTPNFTFKFSVTPQLLPILKEAGVGYLSLANNHALDYGAAGYGNTFAELEGQEVIPFGHPSAISSSSVSYIDMGDKKVAVIGISNLFYKPTPNEWGPIVEEAKSNSDLQVVYVHWGEEYELVHSERDGEFAKELIDAGVDVIVGHHPHVVQDIWRYGDGIVFYSLGNFIFDQYWEDAVLTGLTLELSFIGEKDWQVSLVPVESKSTKLQPREMAGEVREAFLGALSARSDPALAESIRQGVISLQF
jgi:poly-gamma-glutamate synthesis protein (capsule biosynthesis protein)